ncbi:Polyisoprenoid-binding protein YceI [Chitinophaga jiangningensis]|uniref:Polyisoprenoid-binding protein YceI n=1 Tax=Chitinophaga jiangningensis TaxID=1419482 RepID=A0A1M7HDJ1_9BACT|nr:YceI family protein [Chitinophaga jiangningensis]SHM26413.1 Polyisoprenoid-binding protein YceI [Chitinophaga jiangningensis]
MTKRIAYTIFLLIILAACQEAPRADKAKVGDVQKVKVGEGHAYLVDTATSIIGWIGTKPTGKHHGTVKVLSGVIYVKDSIVTAAQFVINMKTMENVDLAADTSMKNKLERELKGPLFFDVAQFPTASFEMTAIEPFKPAVDEDLNLKDATHTIKGNFTIKGVTKNISFPAILTFLPGKVSAMASFNIDRTLWGITYRADKSVQDKLINSLVNISFTVNANR